MSEQTLLITNINGSLSFNSLGNYVSVSATHSIQSNDFVSLTAPNDINIDTSNGNINTTAHNGVITINSDANITNSIIIEATNASGGILETAGTGGITLLTSNGDIDILSQGTNINIGVSPVGTPAAQQTQDVNIDCFNNYNVTSGDMYFVSSDVISFVSTTGDIQFGTSSNGAPVIKFQDGNVLINQSSSNLDYQLDVAVSHPSDSKPGYNGIVVNSLESNVAADITLQTSNALADSTQCIISMGAFGSNNKQAIFQSYLVYQTGNMVIRLDKPAYNPDSNETNNGVDFTYYDIGRQIYYPTLDRLDTIASLSSFITPTNDASNITVSGTYTGNTSLIYLLQIDSINPITHANTFKWSNNGGVSFQQILVSIVTAHTPIALDNGILVAFAATTGFSINQQFTFQTKITALVSNTNSIVIPTTMYTLQQFYSYIQTTTPSDIVIKTNSSEKMRITGDGAIGIHNSIPKATFDLNSNYNKILMVNQSISGYQLNPSLSYLESGGYVLVWNSQDVSGSTYDFNVTGQRYMADGTRYGSNFQINTLTNNNQSFPSVAGQQVTDSNHYIVVWASNDTSNNTYKVYCQIFHNNIPIQSFDIPLDTTTPATSPQLYPRVAGLYNGNYIVVWAADDANTGVYAIKGIIIDDNGNTIVSKFQISAIPPSPTLSRNYPYVAGLPEDDATYPNGFVVGYMTAIDPYPNIDPRYTIAIRVFNYNATVSSAEIPITSVGDQVYSSISDGLLSISEISQNLVNGTNGGFVMSFYRSYQADTTLYNIGDNVSGNLSGATATISNLYTPNLRLISLINVSNRFLVGEEITITSTNPSVANVIEKIAAITFPTNSNATITLDVGNKDVMAYRFNSNVTVASQALWSLQVNTSPLYNDLDRFTGNANIFQYKRPLAAVSVDNYATALVTWSNGSIPSIYYQLININSGTLIDGEERLTSQYNGLKQRDQVVTHLQSIQGNDYGFVISWDNQSLDLQNTGIYQQLIGYNHSLFNLEDGNCNLIFNHQNQFGIGTTDPATTVHIKSALSNSYGDPVNPATITLQNTSQHIITKQALQSIQFLDGSSNVLNNIQSVNSLRYDDLYPQPTNLKGFYKFDHSQGTQVVDYSGSSTNLDVGNMPVYINTNGILVNFDVENCWQSGIINNALLYNGVDNYVFVQNNALNGLNTILETTPHKMSVSLWLNIPSDTLVSSAHGPYYIVANGTNGLSGNYQLKLIATNSNNSLVLSSNVATDSHIGLSSYGLIGTTKINDGVWHHIGLTVDVSSKIYLYLDGNIEAQLSVADTIVNVTHQNFDTYFGSGDGTSNFFFGYMDELRFYNIVLSAAEIGQLYSYGDPDLPPKASLFLNPNSSTTTNTNSSTNINYNQGIVIDDSGNINNLSSRPLPYSILSGELIAYSSNTTVFGVGTNFTGELTVGDIVVLDITNNQNEYTVITITNTQILTLDRNGYNGAEVSKAFQSVLRRPSIYTFFDNSDAIRGHIDNYGNMMIGGSKPTTMLEISSNYNSNSSTATASTSIPAVSITNTAIDNLLYGRLTAVNFKGYDSTNILNPPVNLAHIEASHYIAGTNNSSVDNCGTLRFFVNSGSNTVGEINLMTMTSNGNIGIGGQNSPLTLIHAITQQKTAECAMLLESNYQNIQTSALSQSVFDERNDIYFAGVKSITNTINPNIKQRVLSAVSGSNDSNTTLLTGRLDFLVNDSTKSALNGLESKMCLTHAGNMGVNIMQPANMFNVAPEVRISSGEISTITSNTVGGTTITLSTLSFSGFTTEQQKMMIGGSVVVENSALTRANIVSISPPSTLTVDTDLSGSLNDKIHIHYAGLNVNNTNGFTGINTTNPQSVLSVNGSMSLPIVNTTSDITLDCTNYTILCNTAINTINVTLPLMSSNLNGRIYVVKKLVTSPLNTCTITPNGGTIDGASSTTVTTFSKIQSDGSNWWIIG